MPDRLRDRVFLEPGMMKSNNLDFIRCMLAVLVIVSHSFAFTGAASMSEPLHAVTKGWIGFGDLAVDCFFILSGFLVTQSWIRSASTGEFARKRVLRIVPGFLTASIFSAFIVIPLGSGGWHAFWVNFHPGKYLASVLLLREYKQSGAFTNVPFKGVVNGSFWTLQFEFWCYVLTPALVLVGMLFRRWVGLVLFIASVVFYSVQGPFHEVAWANHLRYIFGEPMEWPRLLCFFSAGSTFLLWRDRISYRSWIAALAIVVLVLSDLHPPLLALTLPTAGVYLLFFAAFRPHAKFRSFARFGDFSYGIYLYGCPLQQLGVYFLHLEGSPYTLTLIVLPLAVLAAALSWHGVEKHFLRRGRVIRPIIAADADASVADTLPPLRFLFLYNIDWSHELDNYQRGLVPSHRLFGLIEMRTLGHDAQLCPPPSFSTLKMRQSSIWRLYQTAYVLLRPSRFDAVIATHESAALPLLVFKRLGFLPNVLLTVVAVSLLQPKNRGGIRKRIWDLLLPGADVVIAYGRDQLQWLADTFPVSAQRLFFIPLGIDVDYFAQEIQTSPLNDNARSCLSVGTNEGKDFLTLLAALPDDVQLTVVTDDYNSSIISNAGAQPVIQGRVKVLRGLQIAELRELYRQARVLVIPLADTQWSSGQTVLLENMALGKLVIVSDTSATRDYVQNDVNAMVVRSGDVEQLRDKINQALGDFPKAQSIGQKAAEMTRSQFSAQQSAAGLVEILRQAATQAGQTQGRAIQGHAG